MKFPERIVYVDDEQDLRTIMRETIEAEGFDGSFVTCGSGQELLNRIRVLQPNLILLDVMMPEMDGLDVLAALKDSEDGADVPVIFMTGVQKLEMLEKYKHLGVIGVLHKPFNADSFMGSIEEIWLRYRAGLDAKPSEDESD